MTRWIISLLFLAGCPGDKVETGSPPAHTGEDTGCELLTRYPDADGDGYGDAASPVQACEPAAELLSTGTDCNDTRSDVYPGASELCGDGAVNDCDDLDGSAAEAQCGDTGVGPYTLSTAEARYVGEEEMDFAGYTVAGAGDVNGDGFDDMLLSSGWVDYYRDDVDYLDAAYLVLGPGDDLSELSGADAKMTCAAAMVGSTLEDGDLDLDGLGDMLLGSTRLEGDAPVSGGAFVVYGPVSGEMDLMDADAILLGGSENERAGRALTSPGDVDADGWPDVLVGAPRYYSTADSVAGGCSWEDEEYGTVDEDRSGAAYLELGPVSGVRRLAESSTTFVGEDDGDEAGNSLAWVGDLDGDGSPELFIGASANCEGGSALSGAAYLVSYPGEGVLSLADADAKVMGAFDTMDLGEMLSSAGDTNGDGLAEVMVGAPGDTDSGGLVYILQGPLSSRMTVSGADATFGGAASLSADGVYYFGYAMASLGDLNGDSYDDVAVSTPFYYPDAYTSVSGGVSVFFGPFEGYYWSNRSDILIAGPADEYVGGAMASVGDVDADGLTDLLLGVPAISDHGELTGGGYLLLGGGPLLTRTAGP